MATNLMNADWIVTTAFALEEVYDRTQKVLDFDLVAVQNHSRLYWGGIHQMQSSRSSQLEILSGWKDIADYVGKGVRTVQRYERELGLPIRRPAGKMTASVVATKAEIDAWIAASPLRGGFQLAQASVDGAAVRMEFKRHLTELHRLRKETEQLREELQGSVKSLQANLFLALPPERRIEEFSAKGRRLANVLTFRPAKGKLG